MGETQQFQESLAHSYMEGERGEKRDVYQYRYHHHHDYTPSSSSSSLSTPPTPLPDDLSLFLHHLLLRSSPPSMANNDGSSSFSSPNPPSSIYRLLRSSFAEKDGTFSDPADDGFLSSVYFSGNVGSAGGGGGGGGVNLPSSSVGASENETDHEYDCESEEGLEALVEEGQTKHPNQRSSSKRSRAAEVHNLSEKRRRSRINEKMKALQNLIPNSNKTDKASMLDEAIEYLKQLQLQVQMLSMRNGLSLHPMCLPGVLQPIQLTQTRMGGVGEENETFHMNVPDTHPPNEENVFCLPNQSIASNQPSVPNMSNIICSETSFGLESHFGSFQLQASNEEICREDMVPHQLANVNRSNTNPLA